MDLLQRELARKKSLVDQVKQDDETAPTTKKRKKYMRQSDWRRLEEQAQEQQEKQPTKQQQQQSTESSDSAAPAESSTDQPANKRSRQTDSADGTGETSSSTTEQQIEKKSKASDAAGSSSKTSENMWTDASVALQLRSLGLPIRFFGETFDERCDRLQAALAEQNITLQGLSELQEFRLGKGHGIRNTFLERDGKNKNAASGGSNNNNIRINHGSSKHSKVNQKDASKESTHATSTNSKVPPTSDTAAAAAATADTTTASSSNNNNNTNAATDDPPKYIYRFLKDLLHEWEDDLQARPDRVAQSVAGRNEIKTFKQCKDYIRPLFRLLKHRKLQENMQAHLLAIVQYAEQGEFVKAHDAYLDVAIGRAAWPIGVTMVGIHARTGRAKIESANVAHVMNSELQRKYLTSVKRLLSYAQKKRTDVDPSKKVG